MNDESLCHLIDCIMGGLMLEVVDMITLFELPNCARARLCLSECHLTFVIKDYYCESTDTAMSCNPSVFAYFLNDVCPAADEADGRLLDLEKAELIARREHERVVFASCIAGDLVAPARPEVPALDEDEYYVFSCNQHPARR